MANIEEQITNESESKSENNNSESESESESENIECYENSECPNSQELPTITCPTGYENFTSECPPININPPPTHNIYSNSYDLWGPNTVNIGWNISNNEMQNNQFTNNSVWGDNLPLPLSSVGTNTESVPYYNVLNNSSQIISMVNNNTSSFITNNYVTSQGNNTDESNEDEQTTDYNNESQNNIITDISSNILNVFTINTSQQENITNLVPSETTENTWNTETTENTENVQNNNTSNNQYSMLYNSDVNNPFFKCNLGELDYESDEEEDLESLRVMFFWNYEFNYDFFSLGECFLFQNKTELFKSKLQELKSIRNTNNSMLTGDIIKISNKIENGTRFDKNIFVNLYLIVYYDNAKTNMEFYGIYNQELDEEKMIENIKLESVYGKKGKICSTTITNLGDFDFIVLHRKLEIT